MASTKFDPDAALVKRRAPEDEALEGCVVPERKTWDYFRFIREGRSLHEGYAWDFGDLVTDLQLVYPDVDLGEYASEIGVETATLREYARVARAYPDSASRALGPWTVCQVFAAQSKRLELLGEKSWTVREARAKVRSLSAPSKPAELPRPEPGGQAEPAPEDLSRPEQPPARQPAPSPVPGPPPAVAPPAPAPPVAAPAPKVDPVHPPDAPRANFLRWLDALSPFDRAQLLQTIEPAKRWYASHVEHKDCANLSDANARLREENADLKQRFDGLLGRESLDQDDEVLPGTG